MMTQENLMLSFFLSLQSLKAAAEQNAESGLDISLNE